MKCGRLECHRFSWSRTAGLILGCVLVTVGFQPVIAQNYGNTSGQEYGDAVYRELEGLAGFLGYNYNHTAIFAGLDGNEDRRVLQALGSGYTTHEAYFYTQFSSYGSGYYGAYTLDNWTMSFTDRKNVVTVARQLVDAAIAYPSTFLQAPVCIVYYGGIFDGSVADISNIRCDGFVEYCYEKNNFRVWANQDYPDDEWSIVFYPETHNDRPDGTRDPDFEASPWAQRGAPCATGPQVLTGGCSYFVPDTTMDRAAVVSLPTYQITTNGGPGYIDVWIQSTDESGIHLIGYIKPGETNWSFSPKQPQHPTSASYTFGPVRITTSGNFYYAAIDNGGNAPTGAQTPHVTISVPSADVSAPTVAITSPTSSANFSTPNETVNLAGTANDNIGLVQVTWVNDRGGSGTAAGTTSWSISNVSLQQGTNVIAVTGNDAANNTGTDVISVVYTPSSPVTILINGIGTVSPNLNGQMLQIGKSYTVTATPGTGYVFSSWTGAVTSSVPALTFLMQSNMVFQANFIPNPFIAAAGNYQGLFYQTNGATHQSSGFFSATVTSAGLFTAKLLSEGKAYSLKGKFSGTGVSSNSVARTGMTPLTVQLRLDTISNDTLNGEISSGTWMAELIANRATFNSVNHPAPQTGKYTMIIPSNSTASTEPGGDGFGTVLVDGSGNVTFKGVLSDGTKVAQKAVVSKAGQWPFYIPLYTGKGSIFGWLTFSNQPSLDIDGLVDWFKLPQPIAKLYPLGFAIQTEVVGSSYHFSVGVPVLNLAAGQVWCENGNLTESFTNQITLDAASKVTNHSSNRLALTITTTSGLFKGSVMNPQTSSAIPFTGVVLQKPNFGSGYFLGTNQSGRIYFGP